MPDPLHAAIASAIRQPLDGAVFEQCALDLLRSGYYPGLRPIPLKRDAGMDGVAGPDAEPEFVLAATTAKDYRRNLRESIRRHQDAGGGARAFVLATTQEVTGESRQRLMRDAETRWGARLCAIHDRSEFEGLLYRSPRWRKELLGVTRSAPALSRYPVSARPPLPLPPIGRDAELAQLRAEGGDIVLVGKPGVGKTFLLERLANEDWGAFDLGWDIPALKDAVLEMRPRRVVLDDAHLSPDRIAAVRQLRQEMEADFHVVAVSWPGRADEVARLLPKNAERIDIAELERDRIVEIIEAAGVAGPAELQRLIADQSRGRAGLAVVLAQACSTGGIGEVADGRKLLGDLAAWYRRALGEESHQVLGALALAGDAGSTLEQAGEIAGLSAARAGNLVRGLAEGGIIDEAERPLSLEEILGGDPRPPRPSWLRVQPEALRYALVADVFYGGPGSLDAVRAAERLEPPSIAALPLIEAARRGANVDREWLRDRIIDWRQDKRTAAEYACLGPDEMRAALERGSAHRTRIAEACYETGVEPALALRVLMEQAADDERDELGAPDHPLRIAGDFLALPGAGMEARRLAVTTAGEWIAAGGDTRVGFRVLMHAVQLEWRILSTDPGLGTTMTISEGVAAPPLIAELGGLWHSIVDIIERQRQISPDVLDALHPWALPESLNSLAFTLDSETADAIRGIGMRVIGRLADIFREKPGVLYRLRDLAERGSIDLHIDVPDWFASLFPKWENYDEYFTGEAFMRYANEIRAQPAGAAADRLMRIDREAIEAGVESPNEMIPRGARRLARELAARDERPEEMLTALEQLGAGGGLAGWFLDRSAELRRPGWEEAIERLLDDGATDGAAIRTALVRPAGERLKRLAIGRAAPWLGLIESLVLRDEIGDGTLALLFDAPDSEVAREAAMALGAANEVRAGRIGRLPPALLERWKEIVVSVPPDGGGGASGAWRLARVLEGDHALCAGWLRARFASLRDQEPSGHRIPGREVQEAIASLPPEIRTELIGDVPAGAGSSLLGYYIPSLLAGNAGAAAALFGHPELRSLHHLALRRTPGEDWPADESWMERALMAMDHGWEPERIVGALLSGPMSWAGDESAHWQRQAEAFDRLRSPELPDGARRARVVAAGIDLFGKLRDRARRAERDERVFGSER